MAAAKSAESKPSMAGCVWSRLVAPDGGAAWRSDTRFAAQVREAALQEGVPPLLRAKVWPILLGVKRARRRHPNTYYKTLLLRASQADSKARVGGGLGAGPDPSTLAAIRRDIARTLIDQPLFGERREGRGALRRLLFAYAAHNPGVGYCQGMNLAAGLLLLVAQSGEGSARSAFVEFEEAAFWMLSRFMSRRAACYCPSMCGAIATLGVCDDVAAALLPALHAHLTSKDVSIRHVCSGWVVSMLCGCGLSIRATLRVWDAYLAQGERIVPAVVVAALHMCSKEVLELQDEGDITEHIISRALQARATEGTDLMKAVRETQNAISKCISAGVGSSTLSDNGSAVMSSDWFRVLFELRRAKVVRSARSLRPGLSHRLQRSTQFNQKELNVLWGKFLGDDPWRVLVRNRVTNLAHFIELFTHSAYPTSEERSRWKGTGVLSGVWKRWFDLLTVGTRALSFEQFVSGVEALTRSDGRARLQLCYDFCTGKRLEYNDRRGPIPLPDVRSTVDMLDVLYNGLRPNSKETDVFCAVIHEKAMMGKNASVSHQTRSRSASVENKLSFETFCVVVRLHPLLVDFFRLDAAV